jgi:dCMP deaminase
MNWDQYFIKMAMLVSEKSKDPNTKVGAVIVGEDDVVLSLGYNGFPRGVAEDYGQYFYNSEGKRIEGSSKLIEHRWERPEKYFWVEHAERNAIYNAARHGIKLKGSKLFLNYKPVPCADCCRAIIQAGIVEVIGPNIEFPGIGAGKHYSVSHTVMFDEARVKMRTVEWEQ